MGLFKALLLTMIGKNGRIAKNDLIAIRHSVKSFTINGHDRGSRIFKQMNISQFLPAQTDKAYRQYFPPIDMCMILTMQI